MKALPAIALALLVAVPSARGREPEPISGSSGESQAESPSESEEEAPSVDPLTGAPTRFAPVLSGTLFTFGSQLMPEGMLLIRPVFSFTNIRGAYDAQGSYQPLLGDQLSDSAALSLYIEDGLSSRVSVATFFSGSLNIVHSGEGDVTAVTLSDVNLLARVMVAEEWRFLPGFTLAPVIKLPLGNAQGKAEKQGADLSGTGSLDLGMSLQMTKTLEPVLLHATLTYLWATPTRVGGVDVGYAGNFSGSVAVEWPFWRNQLGLQAEVIGRTQGGPKLNGVKVAEGAVRELSFGVGLEALPRPNFQMVIAYQRTLSGRNGPAFDSVLVAFVPLLF